MTKCAGVAGVNYDFLLRFLLLSRSFSERSSPQFLCFTDSLDALLSFSLPKGSVSILSSWVEAVKPSLGIVSTPVEESNVHLSRFITGTHY